MSADFPSELRGFKSTQEISAYFEQHKIPVQSTEIQSDGTKWFFVRAFPYSGIRTVDLYAYVERGGAWDLFSLTYVINAQPKDIELRTEGGFILVIHDDAVIMKIMSRKAAAKIPDR